MNRQCLVPLLRQFEVKIIKMGGMIESNPKRCTHLLLLPDGENSKKHEHVKCIIICMLSPNIA